MSTQLTHFRPELEPTQFYHFRSGGWMATSRISLNEDDSIALFFETSACSGRLISSVSSILNGVQYGDRRGFNKTITLTHSKRNTKRMVETQHDEIDVDAIVEEATIFFNTWDGATQ